MKSAIACSLALAAMASLGSATSVDARSFALSPANTQFVLNGKVSFEASSCKAQWIVRTGAPANGEGRVTIANQFESKRCQDRLTNGLPWKIVATGPHTYLILKMSLGGEAAPCGPGDVTVNLADGVSHMISPLGSCFVRGTFDSTPKLAIVPR